MHSFSRVVGVENLSATSKREKRGGPGSVSLPLHGLVWWRGRGSRKHPLPRRNARGGVGVGRPACRFAIRWGGGVVGVENPLCHVKTREEAWALACRN